MAYIAEPYPAPVAPVEPKPLPIEETRFASIDALKGFAILAIWLINVAPASAPSWLKPGPWGAPRFADFIFPSLIFAIGAGIPLSATISAQKKSFSAYLLKSISRAFWLIAFGIVLDSFVAKRPVMDIGALQLLGLAYLVNSVFARTPVILRAFLAEGLLLAFYGWARLNHPPNGITGVFNEKSNVIQYINDTVLSPIGLRGVLALIPVTSIMMTASVAGSFFHMEENRFKRGIILVLCGGTLMFFGWLWSLDFTMTAAYWSSSYALFATGAAGAALGLLSLLFDLEKGHSYAYLLVTPSACILSALAGPVLLRTIVLNVWRMPGSEENLGKGLQRRALASAAPPLNEWVYPIAFVALWWVVLTIAYHRRRWLKGQREESPLRALGAQPANPTST